MGSTSEPLNEEARRRARETLFSQLRSLDARMEEASRAAFECARGWGIATTISEAQSKLDEARERLDALLRYNP